jgi:osmotically-inducible protein OsmY
LTEGQQGTTYYYAVYDGALTGSEVSTNAAALLIDDDQITPAVAVTPDGLGSPVLRVAGTEYTQTFTVTNNSGVMDDFDLLGVVGPGPSFLTIDSITGANVTQGAVPDSAGLVSLAGGAGTVVTAWYTVAASTPGRVDTLYLTARSITTPATLDQGYAEVEYDIATSVALSGTVTDDSETEIRAGGSTILLTLTGDTWVAAGATFDAERLNIINGLVSAQSEATGWNNVVQAGLAVTDVVRTSNTVVTVTLPAFAGYNITATETITATVPASALDQSTIAVAAVPTFDVTVDPAALLGRYWFNEAPSGQGPATVIDDQASPINLAVTYDTPVNWTVQNGHRGIGAPVATHVGVALGDVTGTKYTTNLDGATQGSFVTVAEWGTSATTQRIIGFDQGGGRVAMTEVRGNGDFQFRFRTTLGTFTIYWGGSAWADSTRRVFHVVLNTNEAVQEDRVKLYMNGVDQGNGTSGGGTWPTAGEVLDFGANPALVALNRSTDLARPLNGTLYYYAAYSGVLTPAQVTASAAALALDDDNLTFTVAVTPDGSPVQRVAGTEYSQDYTVTNSSAQLEDFDLLARTGPAAGSFLTIDSIVGTGVSQGVPADSARIVGIAAASGETVTVWYTVAASTPGRVDTLFLRARALSDPAVLDDGSFDITFGASVALSGTVTNDSELDIRTGGSTILLTLTGDTWVATGAPFDAERQNIINGLVSAQAEAAGWNALVQAGLAVTDVVRTSATVVTVTLPAFAGYDITATETITATVPASALVSSSSAIAATPTFDVTVAAGSVALSGTVTDDAETDIRTGGSTILLTLTDDTWVAAGAAFDAERQNIINGLVSAQAEAAGWNAVVQAGLAVTDVVRTSNTVVTVTLPAFAGYDITATETITATVLASALVQSGSAIVAVPTFDVTVTAGSAALSGTVTDDSETDIRTGGSTILLTLTDDSWVAAGAAFDAERQNIIDGLVSAQAEAAGWNAVVQAGLAVTDVVRTSNTVVTVTLPAFAGYDITATETITATVPASALVQSGSALVAAPTFDVTVTAGSVALSGTVTDDSETEIRTGGSTILLTLTDDTWVAAGATFDAERQNIINGLVSGQAEAAGWNAVVRAGLAVTDVVRTSNTVVTVTLPAFAGYDITATETITATVPASALVQSGGALVAAPTFDVTVAAGSVALSGTVTDDSETDIDGHPHGRFDDPTDAHG